MNDMTETHTRISPIKSESFPNELQQAEIDYNNALKNMVLAPTQTNKDIFYYTNKRFTEIRDAYRKGADLLRAFYMSKLV